ncbi:MAG: TIGR00366 family protein [Polyangiaceae bacterium]
MSGADLPASLGGSSATRESPGHPSGERPPEHEPHGNIGILAKIALAFTSWAERWIPDAYVFALVATVLVVLAAVLTGKASVREVAMIWGGGLWDLLAFTLQMSLVIITGYVLATSRPVFRAIAWLASLPSSPRAAVAMVALLAMLSSWLNWGFSLIFGAMLARETARRVRGLDYRAVAASAFLGLGSVWAQGLSGSAALQMASPASMQKEVRAIVAHGEMIPGGVIPLTSTIFLWQSLVSVVVEIVIVTALMYFATPPAESAKSAADLGVDLGQSPLDAPEPARRGTPGEWLEHSAILPVVIVALSSAYLVSYFASFDGLAARLNGLNLNTVNLMFLTLGVALHRTPARLMRAFREATPGVWAVILQFPLYAGIAAIITKTHLNETIASWFVAMSSKTTFPAVIAVYSAVLGVFVPSGGSKWVIEAPYVMQAAHDLQVNLGWMVAVYDLGEAIANLVQPFWMLPVLGFLGLKSRDVMGFTFLVFLVLTPVVLVIVTVMGATLSYP